MDKETQQPQQNIQTIQQTSKQLKKQLIYAAIILFLGFFIMISSLGANSNGPRFFGIFLTIVGLIWLSVAKLRIWWHHK